jgi:hypothetical protein
VHMYMGKGHTLNKVHSPTMYNHEDLG